MRPVLPTSRDELLDHLHPWLRGVVLALARATPLLMAFSLLAVSAPVTWWGALALAAGVLWVDHMTVIPERTGDLLLSACARWIVGSRPLAGLPWRAHHGPVAVRALLVVVEDDRGRLRAGVRRLRVADDGYWQDDGWALTPRLLRRDGAVEQLDALEVRAREIEAGLRARDPREAGMTDEARRRMRH